MGELEALGDAVTGGLLGRAVEPHAGEKTDGHTHEKNCLNCGTRLAGLYCHSCGQHAHAHRTLAAFAQDFLTGALNFEGKIFRTLPLLAWRPGDLTRRYVQGQRARFVSPLALFLFCVFLLFATFQLVGGSNLDKVSTGEKVYSSTDEAIAGTKAKIAHLEERRPKANPEDRKEIDRALAEEIHSLNVLNTFKTQGITNGILAATKADEPTSDIPVFQEAMRKAKANPQLALYKLQDAASKFAWLLIPISVPFMWLLFPFSRRFRLYDHSVFVTYSLSFMMLLAVVLTGWSALGIPAVGAPAVIVPPVHMYRQLKGAYGLGRFGALWRLTLLLTFALTALILFAVAVVILGMSD